MGGVYKILKLDWNGRKMCQLLLLFSFSQRIYIIGNSYIQWYVPQQNMLYTENIIFLVKGQVQVMRLEAC